MFIRYNAIAKIWEYDSTTAATGRVGDEKATWLPLPIDVSQIYNLSSAPPASLPPNIAYKDQANIFTQNQTITKVNPYIDLFDSGQPVDSRRFRILNFNKELYIQSVNDAESASQGAFRVARDGRIITSVGVTFPSAQLASSDPNTLDDYEEGSWIPSFNGDSGNLTGSTYNLQTGRYIKIGRFINLSFDIQISTVGSGAGGNLIVMGIPFYNSDHGAYGYLSYYTNINYYAVFPYMVPNIHYFYFFTKATAGGPLSDLAGVASLVTGTRLIGNIIYRTPD